MDEFEKALDNYAHLHAIALAPPITGQWVLSEEHQKARAHVLRLASSGVAASVSRDALEQVIENLVPACRIDGTRTYYGSDFENVLTALGITVTEP